jgi:DNA-binding NarL/FixJ family response regulator
VLAAFHAYIEYMTNIRVLIVDDVERVRQDLSTFLRLTGDLEIVGEACNGLEAIRQAAILHPQVILMDLEMPVMDGYEAARQIKVLQPASRVIALTIHGGEAQRQQALQAGADDFFVKGASLDALLRSIWTVVENRDPRL